MRKESKDKRKIVYKSKQDIEFKVDSLINELLPFLILLELARPLSSIDPEDFEDITDKPMAAFQFSKRIKEDYFDKVVSMENDFTIRPGLLYTLLNDMADEDNDIKFLKKEKLGSEYRLNGSGARFLLNEIQKLDKFISSYQEKKNKFLNLIEKKME